MWRRTRRTATYISFYDEVVLRLGESIDGGVDILILCWVRQAPHLLEVFNIVNGYEDVDRNMFFKHKEGSRTRGHKAALVKEQCKLDMRKYSFSQRVIN